MRIQIKKSYVFTIIVLILIGLVSSVYNYMQIIKTDTVEAYGVTKPANGHSWSEMQCTTDLCVVGGKVGIGTDNPTEKLQVVGNFKASGDVCNGTGNCLSALATLTNACGGAATTYNYAATAYSGAYCVMGTSTPPSPAWPAQGASTSWTCPVTSGSPISCTATHTAAPVNGVCGPAATTYVYSATAYSGALCTTGAASPASPAFPDVGSSTSWSCLGINGGSSPSCTASRSNPPWLVGGSHTEPQCVAAGGEVVGTGGGANQCRFSGGCPTTGGWVAYLSWTTTSAAYCSGGCGAMCTACTTGSHAWGNIGRETCGYVWNNYYNLSNHYEGATCWSSLIQTGCN